MGMHALIRLEALPDSVSPKRYIRGSGLAYGAYVSLDVESGLLSFTLYRVSS